MKLFLSLQFAAAAIRGSRDPFWVVNEDDYCAKEGPHEYVKRGSESNATLISTQILFRHGARTEHQRGACFPDGKRPEYACDEKTGFNLVSSRTRLATSLTKSYGNAGSSCALGQLLHSGIEQASRLGEYLKAAYPSLSEANIERISLYSTDTQRTMGTLSVIARELFPNLSDSESITVNTSEFDEDTFALNIPSCPSFVDLRKNFRSSSLYKDMINSSEFLDCAHMWTNAYKTNLDIGYSDDCLLSAICADVPLPDGMVMNPAVFKCVMDLAFNLRRQKLGGIRDSLYYNNATRLCRIGSHKALSELRQSVDRGDVGGLYAIHDETFVCLMSSLGLWKDLKWPKYAEFLSFEFYSDDTVRVIRNGQVLADTIPISKLIIYESQETDDTDCY